MANNTITVFEHATLHLGEQGFGKSHFEALVKFNDLHGSKYFIPGLNKIKFKSYVGVIQAGDKTIEILPKADNNPNGNDPALILKWQQSLLYMLKTAGYIKLNETEHASQKLQCNNLLDIYIYTFLKEVEVLIHRGLVKKYQSIQKNENELKGRLLIHKQIQLNSIHKERFFTEHTIYDINNVFNSILKTALEIIQLTSTNYIIKREAGKQLLYFDNVASWRGNRSDFDKLIYDRKTRPYKYAMEIARMIILNYNPDMSAGNKSVIAILFDMNLLFEKFIYRILQREEVNFLAHKLQVSSQNSLPFWNSKTIRPDIIIDFEIKQEDKIKKHKIIVDTKWKVIDAGNPSDNDLKQMYAYNFQFGSTRSVLFYPYVNQKNTGNINYDKSVLFSYHTHGCELFFAELFDEYRINGNMSGEKFIQYLITTSNLSNLYKQL
jgi:5-methylcytosine-specific restriction enzyme subunit McrC